MSETPSSAYTPPQPAEAPPPKPRRSPLPLIVAAGVVLLIAMIGAIVLTLRHRPGVHRQDLAAQANRERAKAVEVKSVATGQGVTPEELL